MPSVVGMLEERELAARVRTEALREEADRVLAALADSESEWQEWVIARQRVDVVLREGSVALVLPEPQSPGGVVEAAAPAAADTVPVAAGGAPGAVVPGAVSGKPVRTVPVWAPGLDLGVLRENYRAVVEALVEAAESGGESRTRSCPEIAVALGMEVTKNNVEGRVRHVAKAAGGAGLAGRAGPGPVQPRRRASLRVMSVVIDHTTICSWTSGSPS